MSPLPTAHVPLPDLAFSEDGAPYSREFGDIYFSRAGGAAETEHVFLRGNDLPMRWQGRPHFTISELGFGTGLNFLVTYREFLRRCEPSQHLHFISVERYPLTPEMLAQAHAAWLPAEDAPLLKSLLDHYPLRLPGWHQLKLPRCTLTLGFGDADTLLTTLDAQVDAWFLDGFSPAKNPGMWEESVLAQVARLSAADASFATFTAAGAVNRALQAHGFDVQKTAGFGHKRDMLIGKRANKTPTPPSTPSSIFVIGAGIAGATIAHALAERGAAVTVLERTCIASGASGNPAAVLYPQLTKFYTPATAWHFTGYDFMLRQIARWKALGLNFTHQQPGMLRLPRPDQSAEGFASLQLDASIMRYVTRTQAAEIAGMDVASDGWFLPHGSWISPPELCHALLQHTNITLREQTGVQSIARDGNQWRVTLDSGEMLAAEQLIVANAGDAPRLLADYPMPMGISAGQVSIIPAPVPPLHCIISHRGYVIPAGEQWLMGATYDRSDYSGAVTDANHAENLVHARAALPGLALNETSIIGRTSLRATTPDRLPYVGELAPGLHVSIGHGSRGMISAPLAAEILAAQLFHEPIPLARNLLAAIHPRRRTKAK